MDFINHYLTSCREAVAGLDKAAVGQLVKSLAAIKKSGGRLFVLGVGGSAANASHAVNDFRKLCGIEAYAPTDNVSELTARTNDEGWPTVLAEWLKVSRLRMGDGILVLSVGGGDAKRNISPNLVAAVDYARQQQAAVLAIVGRDGGYAGQQADVAVMIPTVADDLVTPLAESLQAVIWHLLVSHPLLREQAGKWEQTVADR
ncbi:MAG: SIS domain-containing protein [Negativicutes bacterium]|nr:SIS domain-containing protein [Negativicutes bacterium]